MGRYTDNFARPFTEKNKRHNSFCIYCGKKADTREHVPSKIFVDEPYPEGAFSIVPACFDCNNYSNDEIYVASLVNKIFCALSGENQLRYKIVQVLGHDKRLDGKLINDINVIDGKVHIRWDTARLKRIILKLALGHIASKFDEVFKPESQKISCEVRFKPDLTQGECMAFEQMPITTAKAVPFKSERSGFSVCVPKINDAAIVQVP
jgi:hypothetical protein